MERSFFALQARSFVTGDKNPIQLDQINDLRSSRFSAAQDVVSTLAGNGKYINRKTMDNALDAGLSEAEYIELIGVTTRSISLDIFSKGVGLPYATYENPENSVPTKQLPTFLKKEGAWIRTIPAGDSGGTDGKKLYGDIQAPFIFRALSLVPDEAKEVMTISTTQYVPAKKLMSLEFSHEKEFGRSLVELVAGRTSALNECFY